MARLKFTVVSEPMDDGEECVDVGHAFLDLQELLLTGDDVSDQQINGGCLYLCGTFDEDLKQTHGVGCESACLRVLQC